MHALGQANSWLALRPLMSGFLGQTEWWNIKVSITIPACHYMGPRKVAGLHPTNISHSLGRV
jgi:hypothetical protein